MKRLILGLFMVFGLAVSVANAESKTMAEEAVEGFERIKAKYPKSYNACMNYDTDSKYYYDSVCDYLFSTFTAIDFFEREDGTRYSARAMTWRELEKEYGEEGKKTLLKYGVSWNYGGSDVELAERYAKISERR